MFGSTILDVAIGLIFSFLAISLFTSATVEAINSLLQLRAVNLKSGIMALVNDPGFAGLAKGLYEHPLYQRPRWLTHAGDSRIAAGLIQVGAGDSRHAISGQIARGLFG